MYQESLGSILRMERFKRNLTQKQVCKAIHMQLGTLSRIENNRSVKESTIKRLLDFYQINEEKAPLD